MEISPPAVMMGIIYLIFASGAYLCAGGTVLGKLKEAIKVVVILCPFIVPAALGGVVWLIFHFPSVMCLVFTTLVISYKIHEARGNY